MRKGVVIGLFLISTMLLSQCVSAVDIQQNDAETKNKLFDGYRLSGLYRTMKGMVKLLFLPINPLIFYPMIFLNAILNGYTLAEILEDYSLLDCYKVYFDESVYDVTVGLYMLIYNEFPYHIPHPE